MRTRLCPRPAPRRRSETRARSKVRAAGRRQSGSLRRPAPSGKRRSRCARRSAAHAGRTSARALFCHRPRSPCGPCAGQGPGPGGRLQGSCRNCTPFPCPHALHRLLDKVRLRRPRIILRPQRAFSFFSRRFLPPFFFAFICQSHQFSFFCLLLHSFFIFSPLSPPFF